MLSSARGTLWSGVLGTAASHPERRFAGAIVELRVDARGCGEPVAAVADHAMDDSRLRSENRGREQTEVRSTFDLSARIAAYATPTQRVHALRSQNALPCRSRLHKTSAASSPISTALHRIRRPRFIALPWRSGARRGCRTFRG